VHSRDFPVLNNYKDFGRIRCVPPILRFQCEDSSHIHLLAESRFLHSGYPREAYWHNRCPAFGRQKQKGKSNLGSGSETTVARRFGEGVLLLSNGGSFGGTEQPITVEEQKGRAADKPPDETRGSLAGFISGPHAFYVDLGLSLSYVQEKKGAAGSIEPGRAFCFCEVSTGSGRDRVAPPSPDPRL